MRFEWDPAKAAINIRKHGVSFDEAVTVFKDPLAFIFDDETHSKDEHREIIIGKSVLRRMVLVVLSKELKMLFGLSARVQLRARK